MSKIKAQTRFMNFIGTIMSQLVYSVKRKRKIEQIIAKKTRKQPKI